MGCSVGREFGLFPRLFVHLSSLEESQSKVNSAGFIGVYDMAPREVSLWVSPNLVWIPCHALANGCLHI